jgi:hypothetical protein
MLSAPYSEHFNALIRNFPRFFDKQTKIWEFEIEFVDQIVDIASKIWRNVIRPPFLLMEIFEYLTEDDLRDMYENLLKRHRSDKDKTFLDLLKKFFGDYIDLTEIMRKKKRLIRLEDDLGVFQESHPVGLMHPNSVGIGDLIISARRSSMDTITRRRQNSLEDVSAPGNDSETTTPIPNQGVREVRPFSAPTTQDVLDVFERLQLSPHADQNSLEEDDD